jgi:hypothetical protein
VLLPLSHTALAILPYSIPCISPRFHVYSFIYWILVGVITVCTRRRQFMPSSLSPPGDPEHAATMNDRLARSSLHWFLSPSTGRNTSASYTWGRPLIWGSVLLTFGCCALLLFNTLFSPIFGGEWSVRLWAVPLLLMSLTALFFLFLYRSSWQVVFKVLFTSVAFLFWGIDLLLPSNWLTRVLYDIVIVLIVLIAIVVLLSLLLPALHSRSEEEWRATTPPQSP